MKQGSLGILSSGLLLSLSISACGPSLDDSNLLGVETKPIAGPDLTALTGPKTGLASWYRANSSADSTNGTGWCG
ncbi:MAG: hypothetical protein EOP04_14485, partial [Proteobacteria bacterium]